MVYQSSVMESMCKVPLLWNANGYIEVIQQDDISQDEADRVIKFFEGTLSDNDGIFRPSSRSSNEFSSESDGQEKAILETEESRRYVKRRKVFDSYMSQMQRNDSDQHKNSSSCVQLDKDEKTHVCDICGKRFSRKFNLNTHIKCVHSDEKDYVCSFCKRAFNHSSNLRKHIKTVHGTEKRLPCPLCKKPFKHADALSNHIKVIHGLQDNKKLAE